MISATASVAPVGERYPIKHSSLLSALVVTQVARYWDEHVISAKNMASSKVNEGLSFMMLHLSIDNKHWIARVDAIPLIPRLSISYSLFRYILRARCGLSESQR